MMCRLLSPLSGIYGLVTSTRNYLYDRGVLPKFKSGLQVISVGNITVGGSGKTPLCVYLAQKGLERGARPVILSRGYMGRAAGPIVVTPNESALDVGDEPLLMARLLSTPVVVAKDRVAGARYIESQNIGDCIILDDGFQHRRLDRDVDIVNINISSDQACEDFIAGHLLPAGRLREGRDVALRRASLIMFNSRGPARTVPSQLQALIPAAKPCFSSWLVCSGLIAVNGSGPAEISEGVAVTGIANPDGFYSSIESLGVKLIDTIEFPDHHKFTPNEIDRVRRDRKGAAIVISPKDFVRMSPSEWGPGVYTPETTLKVGAEEKLLSILFPR